MVLASTDTIWLVNPSVSCTGLRGTVYQQCLFSLVQNHMYEVILRCTRKQFESPLIWLIFYVLPHIPGCLSFTAHQDLINGLFGSLKLLQEYFGDAGEEWAYFIKHCRVSESYHRSEHSAAEVNRLDDIRSAT